MAKTYEITLDNGKTYEVDVEDQDSVLNTLPGIPKVPLPGALSPDSESLSGPPGLSRSPSHQISPVISDGVKKLIQAGPAFANGRTAVGVSNAIEGAGEAASPLLPGAMISAPVRTLLSMGLGSLVGLGGKTIADAAGAEPDTAQAVGDVSGLVSGSLGARPEAGAILKGVGKGVWDEIKPGNSPVNLGRLLRMAVMSASGGLVHGVPGAAEAALASEAVPVAYKGFKGGVEGYKKFKDLQSTLALKPSVADSAEPAARFTPGQYDAPKPITPMKVRSRKKAKAPDQPSVLDNAPKAQLSGAEELAAKIQADLLAEKAAADAPSVLPAVPGRTWKPPATPAPTPPPPPGRSMSWKPPAVAPVESIAKPEGIDAEAWAKLSTKDKELLSAAVNKGAKTTAEARAKQGVPEPVAPKAEATPITPDPIFVEPQNSSPEPIPTDKPQASMEPIPGYMQEDTPRFRSPEHASNAGKLVQSIHQELRAAKVTKEQLDTIQAVKPSSDHFWGQMSKKLGKKLSPETIQQAIDDYDPGPRAFSKSLLGDFAAANGLDESAARTQLEAEGWRLA